MLTNLVAWSRAEQFTPGKDLQPVNSSQTEHRKPDHVLVDGILLQTPLPRLLEGAIATISQLSCLKALEALRTLQLLVGNKQKPKGQRESQWEQHPECNGTIDCWQKALEQHGREIQIDAENGPSREALNEHKAD